MNRPLALVLLALSLRSASALAQPGTPDRVETSLAALASALHDRDMAATEPLLAPDFHVGTFEGDMARSIFRQVVESGRVVPDAIDIEEVIPEGGRSRVRVTFRMASGDRPFDVLVAPDGRFVEVNIMRVTATNETRTVGEPPPAAGAGGTESALAAELLRLVGEDQAARVQWPEDSGGEDQRTAARALMTADSVRSARLVEIIETHGWPGPRLVGPQASLAAFVLFQHAPAEIQERFLPLARRAAEAGELPASNLAYVEDRVLVWRGEKQRYGTQLHREPGGSPTLWPVDDPANVDARRQSVGLEPLAKYLQRFGVDPAGSTDADRR